MGFKDIYWPDVEDREGAKKAANMGGSAAILVAGITAGVALFAAHSKTLQGMGFNHYALVDAGAFFIIGIFLFRKSRIAAVIGLVLFIVEKAVMMAETHSVNYMGIFFILCFVNACRGTFAYHSLKKLEEGATAAAGPASFPTPGGEAPAVQAASTGEPGEKSGSGFLATIKWVFAGMALLAVTGGVLFMLPTLIPKSAQKKMGITLPKMPSFKKILSSGAQDSVDRALVESAAPAESKESGMVGARTFRLKNGKTVRGRVVFDDPVYYTVKTLTGQEIVIRDDIAEES